ncbi:MAG: 7-carboxy-7-deazaguanine synthase QueE, partial [Acidobacteria bacterium]|nr:7-carboxy-7-deazaguanine synthase QueE [Acidobacteriota bacterium]
RCVFVRLTGCHLRCAWCDTTYAFTEGAWLTLDEIVERVREYACPTIEVTGGEPLLQMDGALVEALHARRFAVAIETNGTRLPPPGIDWICISPKAGAPLALTHGDELKLVFPQPGAEPEQFESLDFRYFYLQPMDGPQREENTQSAVCYCLKHPHWRVSLQTQKFLGIP